MLNTPFTFVKKQLVSPVSDIERNNVVYRGPIQEKGAAKSCLATELLEKWTGPETSPEKREYIIKCLTATAYSGMWPISRTVPVILTIVYQLDPTQYASYA